MDSVLARAAQALLKQPGVAAVEELAIKRRWGRTRSVTACISIHDGADAREVCRRAAQELAKQLRLADICLMIAVVRAETESRKGTL